MAIAFVGDDGETEVAPAPWFAACPCCMQLAQTRRRVARAQATRYFARYRITRTKARISTLSTRPT
eukprot:2862426-Amphidinium_carterae.1